MAEFDDSIRVKVGSAVDLLLDRHGVGGYLWTASVVPDFVRLTIEGSEAGVAQVGEGAALRIRLIVDATGTHKIVFERRRPWGDRDLIERRVVTLVAS